MPERGRFLTIEGGEGVGKSRLQRELSPWLAERYGVRVCTTHEPGGTPSANAIRQVFAQPAADDPYLMSTELFLIAAARAQHVGRLIEPELSAGAWVLSDRFADSTRVYQGTIGGIDRELLEQSIALSTNELTPDLTLLLDCPSDVARQRVGHRQTRPSSASTGNDIARYDNQDSQFYQDLRQAYLALADQFPERVVRISAAGTPEDTLAAAQAAIDARWPVAGVTGGPA